MNFAQDIWECCTNLFLKPSKAIILWKDLWYSLEEKIAKENSNGGKRTMRKANFRSCRELEREKENFNY